MKKNGIEMASVRALLGLALCIAASLSATNKLNKVFYHRGTNDSLELGQVVLCFDNELDRVPSASRLTPKTKSNSDFGHKHGKYTKAKVFTIPQTKIATKSHALMREFNSLFFVSLEQENNGISLCISYDPNYVEVGDPEKFINIDMQKGLVVRFYNKQSLDRLKNKSSNVLTTVSATHRQPKIVVDCGHGGNDNGAIGHFNIHEKDIALDIGLQLASLLRRDGYDVFLTRTADETLMLDERTTLANACKGDLFISIHANHAARAGANGIETFCLKDGLFKPFASNNDPYLKQIQELQHLRNAQSIQLAQNIHQSTLDSVKKKHQHVNNRGVIHKVSQVLLGTTMPAALIEVGFLSNEQEAALLLDLDYRQHLVVGMRNGIVNYLEARADDGVVQAI